jgi:hypothetical protein
VKAKEYTATLEEYEGSELEKVFKVLFADLSNAPDEVRDRALSFFNPLSELIRFESGVTAGTVMPILIKPTDLLLNLCVAVRTGNFDFLVVEHGHSFSSVKSGLVELPSISTLEKLPKNGD